MHWRICGSTLALLSFAAVCLNGLLRGHSFTSVTRHSLLAMVIGGAAGIVAAVVIRYVVREEFERKERSNAEAKSPAQAAGASRASSTEGPDGIGAGDELSGTPGRKETRRASDHARDGWESPFWNGGDLVKQISDCTSGLRP